TDPDWRDEIAARGPSILLVTQGPRAAAEAAEPLLRRTKGSALVWGCVAAGPSLGWLGRLDDSFDVEARGHEACLALVEPPLPYAWHFVWQRCMTLAHAGRLIEAERLATAGYQQGLTDGSPEAQASFAWSIAQPV